MPSGPGPHCTDPAQVTVTAPAPTSRRDKWVAGNPALGWWNDATKQAVPVGGAGCLSLEANGRTYTTNPCIALVNPGEPFHYVLRVQNAGTESALQMTIIDDFPAPGDASVLGAARGTQWATAPTLAGPATYSGPSTGDIGYTSGALCTDDLFLDQAPCPASAWADAPGTNHHGPATGGHVRPGTAAAGRHGRRLVHDERSRLTSPGSPTRRSPGTPSPTPRSPRSDRVGHECCLRSNR